MPAHRDHPDEKRHIGGEQPPRGEDNVVDVRRDGTSSCHGATHADNPQPDEDHAHTAQPPGPLRGIGLQPGQKFVRSDLVRLHSTNRRHTGRIGQIGFKAVPRLPGEHGHATGPGGHESDAKIADLGLGRVGGTDQPPLQKFQPGLEIGRQSVEIGDRQFDGRQGLILLPQECRNRKRAEIGGRCLGPPIGHKPLGGVVVALFDEPPGIDRLG